LEFNRREELSACERFERNVADAIPLRLYQALVRREVIGLVYHSVAPVPPPYLKHIYPIKTPEDFERDLVYLKAHFELIGYPELVERLRAGTKGRPNAVLLTFDDGYRECFTVIRPLLRKHGLSGVFFVATDFIDNRAMFYRNKASLCIEAVAQRPEEGLQAVFEQLNRTCGLQLSDKPAFIRWMRGLNYRQRSLVDEVCTLLQIDPQQVLQTARPYMTGEQIKTLAEEGFTIGAHSRGHPKFNLLSREQIEAEILASCQAIQEITQQDEVPFAFPFSAYGVDRRLLARLVARHRRVGYLFDSKGFRRDAPFIVNRVWADPPPEPSGRGSNLPELLHAAYREYVLWRRRYLQSVLLARLRQIGRAP